MSRAAAISHEPIQLPNLGLHRRWNTFVASFRETREGFLRFLSIWYL
jgi:hypothetical protein